MAVGNSLPPLGILLALPVELWIQLDLQTFLPPLGILRAMDADIESAVIWRHHPDAAYICVRAEKFLPPLGILAGHDGIRGVDVAQFRVSTPFGDSPSPPRTSATPRRGRRFYPLWGFSAHVLGSCGFLSFSLVSVGTARPFQPPLYIHIRPLSHIVGRHSSRYPLCKRRVKRAILRACVPLCRVCISVKEGCL